MNICTKSHLILAAALFSTSSVAQSGYTKQPPLGPGMVAPKLSVGKWLKGTPITDLKEGIFVIEFWATWCGPCKEAMPHLSELAKKHPTVTFIGISIFEDDEPAQNIQTFVDKMGDKMGYNVTMDKSGLMAKSWMTASKKKAIPATYVIKNGIIQWIGLPGDLAKPLEQINNGTFDLKASKKDFEGDTIAYDRQIEVTERLKRLTALLNSGKGKSALREVNRLLKQYPEQSARMTQYEATALALTEPKKARETIANDIQKKNYFQVAKNLLLFNKKNQVAEYASSLLLASPGNKDPMVGYCMACYFVTTKNRIMALRVLDLADQAYIDLKMDFPDIKNVLVSKRKEAVALK